ncbi:hypothetical protein RF11_01846 [Thelohanellus kitauei]|uniref:Uncharacterized protein n=1 Tax=Thelohanellus kitauei TaxID=669202 RepID=A0A0C2MFE6_THEKT|nr:hypothetical protein RF11_01846 [Thelohanellus kitauei]
MLYFFMMLRLIKKYGLRLRINRFDPKGFRNSNCGSILNKVVHHSLRLSEYPKFVMFTTKISAEKMYKLICLEMYSLANSQLLDKSLFLGTHHNNFTDINPLPCFPTYFPVYLD